MTGDRWAHVKRFGPLVLIVLLLAAVFASGLFRHLSLHELGGRRAQLQAMVRLHPLISLAGYMAAYTAVIALSLPAALVMTLAGGLLFGPWVGGLASAVSCTLGSCAIFLVCRTAAGDVLQRRAGPAAARIEAGVKRDAFFYILTLRLLPVMPFWLANLALGLIDIPFPTFVAASFLGIAPVSLVYAGLGSSLNTLFAKGLRPDFELFAHPAVVLPLAGLAILSLAPVLLRHRRVQGLKS